jgi:hypothetical protein
LKESVQKNVCAQDILWETKKCVLDRTRNRAMENECGRGEIKYSEETQFYDKFHLNLGLRGDQFVYNHLNYGTALGGLLLDLKSGFRVFQQFRTKV